MIEFYTGYDAYENAHEMEEKYQIKVENML